MAASAHATATAGSGQLHPTFANAIAFDVTAPLRDLARQPRAQVAARSLPPERGPTVADRGFAGDGAVQATAGQRLSTSAVAIAPPLASFEGLANADNPFLVSPPDPVGDVGPNHYVEMVNLVFAVYSKTGARLLGPPTASFVRTAQLPVASLDSIFPCNPPPDTRDCIPQPGTTNKLDILSYRQRPTWRLAYRNFGSFDALVTNQSVDARPRDRRCPLV